MARKDAPQGESNHHHGLNDVIGVVLGIAALVVLGALLSHDLHDSSAYTSSPNNPDHKWAGPLGAWLSMVLFRVFGVAAFIIPLLLLAICLGCFFQFLSYLKKRW